MDLIVEKDGIKWLLKNASFEGNKLVYEEATPLELQSLLEEREQIENELAKAPSDDELLEWAKENHPIMIELRRLEERLNQIDERIQELSELSFEE